MTRPPDASAVGWQLAAASADDTWRRIADALDTAARSSRHPFHLLTVASVAADGTPHARTVVLRRFDADRREVWFHTDARSPKVAQLTHDARVALHWYSATDRLQLRIAARATLHHRDEVARAAWMAAEPMSRACYTSPVAPGTVLAGFPVAPPAPPPDDHGGLASFVAVCCRFTDIEALSLHATGHERVVLRLDGPAATREIRAP